MTTPSYLWLLIINASVAIAAVVLFGLAAALKRGAVSQTLLPRAALVIMGWLTTVTALALAGVFQARPNEPGIAIVIAIVVPIILGGLFLRTPIGRRIIDAVPQSWLIGAQTYRSMGAIFLVLYGLGLLPGAFALPAGWGDVAIGLAALPVAALSRTRSSSVVITLWNVLGIMDLVIALATGTLSSPGNIQMLALDQPNYLVSQFPLVLIPTFAVPISIILHMASLMKLARMQVTEDYAVA